MVNMNNMTKEMNEELTFTKEELDELKRLKTIPITFDENCPETTPEMAIKFKRVNPAHQNQI